MSHQFTEKYKEHVFYSWYNNDRKVSKDFVVGLPDDENGKKPNPVVIQQWVTKYGWVERADALDAEVSIKLDMEVVDRRMEMFKKHAEIGSQLIEKGLTYLNENGITSDNAAIRAIDLGISTQRISVGMAEAFAKISKMSDEQLDKELKKLLGQSVEPDYVEEVDNEE